MSLCTYTNAFTQNNTGCSSSVPAEALEDAQHSGLIAASAIINAAPGAPAAPAAAGSTYQNIPVSVLEAAAFKDPDLFKIKVAFMVNEMQALYKEADFVGRQGARTIPMMAWQLASPNGLMAGYAKAMSKTSEAVVAEPDKCVACCDECDEGGCQCTRQDRLLAAWHGNMRQRDDFDDDDDAGAQAGMLTPWRLLYFLCAMGSGKTLPEILMPLLLNWESMMAIRPDEMLAEPCTLLTAPGREQIQQMAMQGLGVTDVGKLSDMPMCYLSGIPAEILVRFNERVVFLDQHTSSQWFHPLNLAKLRKARVFVGGIMKVATLIKYERETLKVPEDERFFHEKKFSLWLADEAHFGIHYPASPFLVPEADGEWAWILHTFKYMFVAKFSGSIHEAEHEGDRVPKGGRCTGGELMYFKRMAEPKITVCSYEGMKKYDGTYFCSHNMTDDDVVKLRTHPRYLNVFFWEVMRDVLRRRRETGLPLTAMIRVPEIAHTGVEGIVDMFNKFLEELGDAAICPLTGRLKAVGTWSQGLSQKKQARAMNGIRWAVEADVLFVYNQCVLGYDNQSMMVTGNARATTDDWDAGQTSNQFNLRCGRPATDTAPNHLGLHVAALHHVGCSTCKNRHITECEKKTGRDDFKFESVPTGLCGYCDPRVQKRCGEYKEALTAYNAPGVTQDCGVFLQQIDCEKDSHNWQHLSTYLSGENATNVVNNMTRTYLRERQAEVQADLNAAINKVRGAVYNDEEQEVEVEGEEDEAPAAGGGLVETGEAEAEAEDASTEYGAEALVTDEDDEDDEDDDDESEDSEEGDDDEDGRKSPDSQHAHGDDLSSEDESLTDDDYSDDDSGGPASGSDRASSCASDFVPVRETRDKRKKSHASENEAGGDTEDEAGVSGSDALAAQRLRELEEEKARAKAAAKAEQERIERERREAEHVASQEAAAVDEEADAELARIEADLQARREAAQKIAAARREAAKTKAAADKQAAALRAEADKRRADEEAAAEQAAAHQLANFNDLPLTVKCMHAGDDIKLRFEMAQAPRAGATVGLAISKTGQMAKPGKTEPRSKTSYHLHQLVDGVVSPLEAKKKPYRLSFDRPKNMEGLLHFRIFALKPGCALNDPNPKKALPLMDLMFATAPAVVDVRDLEAAMPAVDEPEAEPRAESPAPAAGANADAERANSDATAPAVVNWLSMAEATIWQPRTGKRKAHDKESVTVKRAHRARGALTALLHNMTPGQAGESFNALYAPFLLDLFGVGLPDKSSNAFPRHFSYGWYKSSEWGGEYVAVLALYLQWLKALPQTDQAAWRDAINQHQALYTVDKVLSAAHRAEIEATQAAQGGRRAAPGRAFLFPDQVLSQFAEGWARLEALARAIRDSQLSQRSVVAQSDDWTTFDRVRYGQQGGKMFAQEEKKRKKVTPGQHAVAAAAAGNTTGGQPDDGELQDENHAQWSEMATERFADVLISGGNHDAVQREEAQEIVKALHRGLAIVRAAQAAVPLEFPTFQSLQETMTFYQPRLCKDGRLEDWAVKNGWCVAPTEGSASECTKQAQAMERYVDEICEQLSAEAHARLQAAETSAISCQAEVTRQGRREAARAQREEEVAQRLEERRARGARDLAPPRPRD